MNTELIQHIDQEIITVSEIINRTSNKMVLDVRRETGDVLRIRLIGENARDTKWYVGKKYCLTNVELRSTGIREFLSSTHDTSVSPINDNILKILIFGDTHIGYHKRSNDEYQNPEYEIGSEFKSFDRITSYYSKLDDTLLFHTGDLFDHNATREDLDHIKESINAN